MKLRLMILFVLLCVSFLWGKDISPKKVIENVEQVLTSSETVKVDFEETYVWVLTGEEQSIRGELLLAGKDRFRVTTEDQIIVSDGNVLWTYNRPSHRVLIDKLASSENAILPRQILFQYTRDYESRVIGENECDGKPCYELLFSSETALKSQRPQLRYLQSRQGDHQYPRLLEWIHHPQPCLFQPVSVSLQRPF